MRWTHVRLPVPQIRCPHRPDDGDMDWFVTAIGVDNNNGHPDGNRLYENRGDGYFYPQPPPMYFLWAQKCL